MISGEAPAIGCFVNEVEFSPGDQLIGSLEIENPGPAIVVDIYVAFVMPGGAIVSLTDMGITAGMYPWAAGVSLPASLNFGPEAILSTPVPGGLVSGGYMFAAALSEPGELHFVGEPCVVGFTVAGKAAVSYSRREKSTTGSV